jgi:CheY-like chemotaxis protein
MSPRILVCDNEEALRDLVRASLSREGYEIEEARDGDEALALALSLRPDLIVLDVMMPGRSGIDVLTQLRSDSELDDVKVVVLTARAQAADRSSAVGAGANAFLSKPFSPLELAALVERLLGEE